MISVIKILIRIQRTAGTDRYGAFENLIRKGVLEKMDCQINAGEHPCVQASYWLTGRGKGIAV